jgi:hypothetical protein
VLILNSGGTGQAKLRFDYEAATERASISVDTSNQRLDFNTANAASPRMSIDSSGRVGIGTTSPNYILETAGDPAFIGVGTSVNGAINIIGRNSAGSGTAVAAIDRANHLFWRH